MAPKNADCPLEAGSISCLMITWTEATLPASKYTLFNTPCQSCPWWDEYAREDDDICPHGDLWAECTEGCADDGAD